MVKCKSSGVNDPATLNLAISFETSSPTLQEFETRKDGPAQAPRRRRGRLKAHKDASSKNLTSRPTKSRGTEYLIRWKGYGPEEDVWRNRPELQNALDLLRDFELKEAKKAQQEPLITLSKDTSVSPPALQDPKDQQLVLRDARTSLTLPPRRKRRRPRKS